MNTIEDRTSSSEIREGYADIGDQRLYYVEAGDGPLIVLLHGFPEFWYGWRHQIQPLAAACQSEEPSSVASSVSEAARRRLATNSSASGSPPALRQMLPARTSSSDPACQCHSRHGCPGIE